MKTLSIRDLRLHWRMAEERLQEEEEIIITRDGTPVAKLVKFSTEANARTRFDPKRHMAELKKIYPKPLQKMDEQFEKNRADRWERLK